MNQIILLHGQFSGESGNCNNGALSAHAVRILEPNHYVSQLSLQYTNDLNGTTIECVYDDGTEEHMVNEITLISTGRYNFSCIDHAFIMNNYSTGTLPPPSNIHLCNVSRGHLHFCWDGVQSTCNNIHYNIHTDGCGLCPVSTRLTSMICKVTQSIHDDVVCSFVIRTVVCGDKVGTEPNELNATFRGIHA